VKFNGAPQLFDAFGIGQIRRAANFSSRDESRYVLNGVCLDNREADGRIVSTDGRRLFCSKAFSWVNLPKEKSFILPLHPLWHARQLDGPWHLRTALGDRCYVEVHAGGWRIVSKLVDGNYPNWRQIMPKDRPADVFAARIDWQEAKNLPAWIKALPPGKDKHPSLQVTGNGHLEFIHVASGACRQLDARSEGRHVTAHFNAAFISELCALGFRSWELVDELTPLVARSDAGDTVIVMPLRMTEPEPVAAEAAPTAQPEPAAA
jgi:DNA polymerase-3 subunit beta